jgi:hypothetical protein
LTLPDVVARYLIGQLQSAPVAVEGVGAGAMVDPRWKSSQGHAVAAARYGAMSWQLPAKPVPEPEPKDYRTQAILELLRRHEERADEQDRGRWRGAW